MTTPTTAAGHNLLVEVEAAAHRGGGITVNETRKAILAIETEAVAAERARLRAAVEARIAELSQPNRQHIYGRGGIHAEITVSVQHGWYGSSLGSQDRITLTVERETETICDLCGYRWEPVEAADGSYCAGCGVWVEKEPDR